jgi:hypothetical protein
VTLQDFDIDRILKAAGWSRALSGECMNPKRRTALVDRLSNGIGYIATDFEKFCGLFIQAILELPLDHRGLNLLGYPVAGVVDTTSGDGKVVVEYSDRTDYLGGDMDKARGDLAHALSGCFRL